MQAIISASLALFLITGAVFADDDNVSAEEARKITAALAAIGCTPGEMERDDDGYEVDDAKCPDGEYEFKLNKAFEIVKKERN